MYIYSTGKRGEGNRKSRGKRGKERWKRAYGSTCIRMNFSYFSTISSVDIETKIPYLYKKHSLHFHFYSDILISRLYIRSLSSLPSLHVSILISHWLLTPLSNSTRETLNWNLILNSAITPPRTTFNLNIHRNFTSTTAVHESPLKFATELLHLFFLLYSSLSPILVIYIYFFIYFKFKFRYYHNVFMLSHFCFLF